MRKVSPLALLILFTTAGSALAQTPQPVAVNPPSNPAPAPTVIAATVNGQTIQELAVFRALQHLQPPQRAGKREEVLNFLIETALVDQYLDQLKIAAAEKD